MAPQFFVDGSVTHMRRAVRSLEELLAQTREQWNGEAWIE